MSNKRVIVIGGGMAGLGLSYHLLKRNYQVKVFEKAPFWGGADASIDWHGLGIEKHYHHYFSHDHDILKLIHDLGLSDRLRWKPGSTGVYFDGKAYNLAPMKFLLFFKPLPLRLRLSFLWSIFKILRGPKPSEGLPELENLSASEWACQFFGKKVAEVMWLPLLRAKFGSSFEHISASFLYGRIYNRVSSSAKKSKKELLGYLLGSSSVLIEALIAALQRKGCETHLANGISEITFEGNCATGVKDDHGVFHEADAIILAVQTPAATGILSGSKTMPKEVQPELDVLKSIRYQQVISMILFAKQPLIDHYWLNIADNHFPFPVIVEQTKLIDPENYGGRHLIYVSTYRDPDDKLYQKSDEAIFDYFFKYVQEMNSSFTREAVEGYVVHRERHATPVYEGHFEKLKSPIQSACPNLFYLNGTQVYPDSRNVNKMISLGKLCLQKLTTLHEDDKISV